LVGGESITAACGGLVGGESITAACGGLVGGESITAKAELATAQPATKATRLTFMIIAPSVLIGATTQVGVVRQPAQVKGDIETEIPSLTRALYD
jgi:hypothetical protein